MQFLLFLTAMFGLWLIVYGVASEIKRMLKKR